MRLKTRIMCALLFASLAIALVGCSAGTARGPVSTTAATSDDQAAAAVFVQQWGQILWNLRASQTGTQPPSVSPPVFNPDGSMSQTFIGPDGTEAVFTFFMDGSVTVEVTYPDGTTQTITQSAPSGFPQPTIDQQITSSDGTSVQYTSVLDPGQNPFDPSDDTTELSGTASLPDGLTQDFTVLTTGGQTTVQSQQSDGSTFTMQVPLTLPWYTSPDFAAQSTGTYTIGGVTVQFSLSGTAASPNRWAIMSSQLGGGLTGEFAVNEDFSASGKLLENGDLSALLSWTSTGDTDVNFLTGQSTEVSPAGAALDFLMHRWQTVAALQGPAPGP